MGTTSEQLRKDMDISAFWWLRLRFFVHFQPTYGSSPFSMSTAEPTNTLSPRYILRLALLTGPMTNTARVTWTV